MRILAAPLVFYSLVFACTPVQSASPLLRTEVTPPATASALAAPAPAMPPSVAVPASPSVQAAFTAPPGALAPPAALSDTAPATTTLAPGGRGAMPALTPGLHPIEVYGPASPTVYEEMVARAFKERDELREQVAILEERLRRYKVPDAYVFEHYWSTSCEPCKREMKDVILLANSLMKRHVQIRFVAAETKYSKARATPMFESFGGAGLSLVVRMTEEVGLPLPTTRLLQGRTQIFRKEGTLTPADQERLNRLTAR